PLRSGRRRQPFEILFEIGVFDLREIAGIDRINADLDLRSKRLQTEAVFLPALLEYTQRIPNSLACMGSGSRGTGRDATGASSGAESHIIRGNRRRYSCPARCFWHL